MKVKALIILIGILIVSCSKEKTLKEYMVDDWETSYVKIEMPTHLKSDSLNIFEDDFSKGIAPKAQSRYQNDGTFSAWYLKSDGTKMGETPGKWDVKNDSLYVEYSIAGKDLKVVYGIEKTTEGFLAKSLFDWDGDGENDDLLLMKTKRIVKKN